MVTYFVMALSRVIDNWRCLLLFFIVLLFPFNLFANERIKMHLDRSLLAAGETVWMRAWIMETEGIPASKYLYVELLRDGSGSVERRIKIKQRNGMFIGQMELPENLESGWYTLRAYTRAQKDWPAETLYHTRLLIRGTGPMPSLHAPHGDPNKRDSITYDNITCEATFSQGTDGYWSITLTDGAGKPIIGNFSLSAVQNSLADSAFQRAFTRFSDDTTASFPKGEYEYTQELTFRVKSTRNRLPDRYNVAIMAQEINYYFSTEVTGDHTIKGKDGQVFRILDLDYPEGTVFTINSTGAKSIYLSPEKEPFASPFDYGPTYPVLEENRDMLCSEAIEDLPQTDTLMTSHITTERRPAYYKPERQVGPYSSVFDWRQVMLREDLKMHDNMDLMTFIAASFSGLFVASSSGGRVSDRTMYTTRSGSVSQQGFASLSGIRYNNTASHSPVDLYINGIRRPDWKEAESMSVGEVQNLYVLRGAEAALYKASAVVLLELKHLDEEIQDRGQNAFHKTSCSVQPLGWQHPKVFHALPTTDPVRRKTIYWNPCIRTDAAGRADIVLPDLPEDGCWLRIEGETLDGRWFAYQIKK